MSSDEATTLITTTLQTYRTHLTSSSAHGCASVYTANGCVMPQSFPTQIGKPAIEKWYELCFSHIALDVEFTIEEVIVASEEWAFARTTSAGMQKKLSSGEMTKERNQELFVMQRVEGKGEWRIARYCFCTMNPPSPAAD